LVTEGLVQALPIVKQRLAATAKRAAVERLSDPIVEIGLQVQREDCVGDYLLGAVQIVPDAIGNQLEGGGCGVEVMDAGEAAGRCQVHQRGSETNSI
jgi:hypothetical protein